MVHSTSRIRVLLAACGTTLVATTSLADNWDNSSGNAQWSTATNWMDNTEPTLADFALFPNTFPDGQSVITLTTNEVALSLTFLNSYTLSGGTIRLGNGSISLGGWSPTINSVINGTGPITFSGGGTVTLGASSNSYTGGTVISGTSTTVSIRSNTQLGFNTAPITLNGGRLRLDGSVNPTFIVQRTITPGTSGGTIELQNNALLDLFDGIGANANAMTFMGNGTVELNSASTRTGPTTINAVVLKLQNATGLGTPGVASLTNAATLEVNNGSGTFAGSVNVFQGSTLRGGPGTHTFGGIANVLGNMTLNGGATSSDVLIFGNDAVRQGTGWTTSVNTGTVRLDGANSYAGDWAINGGAIQIGDPASLGSGTGPIVVGGSGRLKINTPTLARDITLNNPGGGIELLQDVTYTGSIPIAPSAAFVPILGANHEFILTGPGTSMTYDGIAIIGGAIGVRSLRVTGGAQVTGSDTRIYGNSSGTPSSITVSGAGSSWVNTNEFWLGNTSNDATTLLVEAGGTLTSPGFYVGVGEDASATITGEGSTLTSATVLKVGLASVCTMDVLAGADVTALDTYIGEGVNASGTLTVNGTGSTWTNQSLLRVGTSEASGGTPAEGVVNLSGSGSLSCLGLHLGEGATASSTLTIVGGLTRLDVGPAGVLMSQGGAASTLNLNGGIVDIHGHITDAGSGQSTFILDGATLDMHNNTIGGVNPIDIPVFRSGTLKNVGEINNGTGFNKDGTGTLYLNTTNTYSGSTTVSEGALYLVDSGGSNTGSSTVVVGNLGTLVGNGRVAGQVINDGHVSPQGFNFNSTATLHMLNSYTQVGNGALDIQIESAGAFDTLEITGSAVLTGTLNVSLLNGYQPTTGDTFTILTASSVNGTFVTVNLPSLNAGHAWLVEYPAGQVRLRVGTSCVADLDDGTATGTPDGGVTIDDLLYYLNVFNLGAPIADVDDGSATGTPDGGVTIDDLLYFLLRFNQGC
ncbi:MAG: autotransporter-associated beta strand repeat-containing protein [Phycisphaerales bacterium]|nr:MAG: autotransporter-associated beta strand repeat-containing protein [Phycisphaerales bacterium]